MCQGKAMKKKAAEKKKEKKDPGGAAANKNKVLDPPPDFISSRLAMWDRLKAEQDARLAALTPSDITVTLPDGKTVAAQSWRTTPYDIALGISKGLADNAVVAKVRGKIFYKLKNI